MKLRAVLIRLGLVAAVVVSLLAGAAPANAALPDPAISAQQAKLVASDAASNDGFGDGSGAAISGDTALVGAPFDDGAAGVDQGSAYVYVRSGSTWIQQQKLLPTDPAAGDYFGYSAAISGDTAIIGAMGDDGPAGTEQGSTYVFTRTGTTWTQQQKLLPTDLSASDLFGYTVAISGDTALIGSRDDDGSAGTDQGSAYVFTRTGSTWTQQQKLLPTDPSASDSFGYTVAISENTALIGVPFDSGTAGPFQGSVYVFTRSGTTWSQQAKITPTDAATQARFGRAVAVSGDSVLVGAPNADGNFASQGTAYVFTRNGTVWTQQAKLASADPAINESFGNSVAISGDTGLVGASNDVDAGAAYVFTRTGSSWTQQPKLLANDAANGDHFGTLVRISGDTALITAWGDNVSPTGIDEGSAYIFTPGAFSISDTNVTEGTGGVTTATFTVSRTGTLASLARVDIGTVAGSATAGADYTSTAATLSFAPGVASRTFSVPIVADELDEPNEIFDVALSNAQGALMADGNGKGTITDDDAAPYLVVTAPSPVTETDDTAVTASFTVTRWGSAGGPVTVEAHTTDGTAHAPDDYDHVSRTLRWADGESGSKTVNVTVEPDDITEATERFFLRLQNAHGATIELGSARVAINDDDVAAAPSLSVSDPTILEGSGGTTKSMAFKVTRSGSTTSSVTFTYATANGTAVAPGDYNAKTGTITMAAGATVATINVIVKGDNVDEPNETLTLTISNPTNGHTLTKASGTGTITDND